MRVRDVYDWLPFKSKEARRRTELQRAQDTNLEAQRQRQAHYRAVTQIDASGHDARGDS